MIHINKITVAALLCALIANTSSALTPGQKGALGGGVIGGIATGVATRSPWGLAGAAGGAALGGMIGKHIQRERLGRKRRRRSVQRTPIRENNIKVVQLMQRNEDAAFVAGAPPAVEQPVTREMQRPMPRGERVFERGERVGKVLIEAPVAAAEGALGIVSGAAERTARFLE